MKRYRVYFEMWQHGELKDEDSIICDTRGKDLDEATVLKRLTNNIKTWQSAYNKDRYRENYYTFKVIRYEEV